MFRYDRRLPFEFVGKAGPIVGRSIDAAAFSVHCADPGDPEIFFFCLDFEPYAGKICKLVTAYPCQQIFFSTIVLTEF